MKILEQDWELDPHLPSHVSFAIDCVPDDYAFRVEFDKSLSADEKIAASMLIAAAPRMLWILKKIDAEWTKDIPEGPDFIGDPARGRIHPDHVEIWKDLRLTLAIAQDLDI